MTHFLEKKRKIFLPVIFLISFFSMSAFSLAAGKSVTLSTSGTLSNLTSGTSGLYFANTITSTNSGWTQTNSWISNSLSENTQYTFQMDTISTPGAKGKNVIMKGKIGEISEIAANSWDGDFLGIYDTENVHPNYLYAKIKNKQKPRA